MKKKIIYGLGSIAVMVAPIAAVISCTPPKSKEVQASVKKYEKKFVDGGALVAAMGDKLFNLEKGAALDEGSFEIVITDVIDGFGPFNVKINAKFSTGGEFNGKAVNPNDKFELLLEAEYKAKAKPTPTDVGFEFSNIEYNINTKKKDVTASVLPTALSDVLNAALESVMVDTTGTKDAMESSVSKETFKTAKYSVGDIISAGDLGIMPKLEKGITTKYIFKSKDDANGTITLDVVLRKDKFIKPIQLPTPIVITGANDLKAGYDKIVNFTTTMNTPADNTKWGNGIDSEITTEFKAIPDLSTHIDLPSTMEIEKVTIKKLLKDNKIVVEVMINTKTPGTGKNINNTKQITVTFTNN